MNDLTLLLVISLFFSLGSKWLGQPFLLGHILTGLCLGPFFGHVSFYSRLAHSLGDLGLLMLIFHIGIKLDLNDFKKMWKQALLIFLLQLFFGLILGFILLKFFHFNLAYSLLCAFLLVLSSTAVVVKLLDEMDELAPEDQSLIVSILIIQDLAIVPMSIILNGIENASFLNITWKVGLSIVGLCGLIQFLSTYSNKSQKVLKPLKHIFELVEDSGNEKVDEKKKKEANQEVITLASLAMCFSFSSLSELLGFSHSYGPFLAGLILGSLGNKKQILAFSKPIGSLLLMSFFIFIGTNIDIPYIKENYVLIVILTLLTLIVRFLVNYCVLRIMKFDSLKSFFISIVLSQASEFSFSFLGILLVTNGINSYQYKLITTLCIISLTLGSVLPLIAQSVKRVYDKVTK
ncbi:cation:proton antiporter [Alphaproteobacteria bacterium endosymbiont of Tiliacea citrago]|uniref:cation:proton antiporter n=1 Tax=Alphaproteobacteria bacterium endosymbiont of Tiliacea citrago TaxID=3077944 RepID=UPI00313EC2F6